MDSRRTVLLAILAAALMVAVSVGCAMAVNTTSSNNSNETAFSADVWKKNTDSNNDNSMILNAMDWARMTSSSAANSDNAAIYGAIRPVIHFDDCSAANSNEAVTPDWFVGKVFEADLGDTTAVYKIEKVYELLPGGIMYCGPFHYTGLTNVHQGGSLFCGTWEEFQQYVIAHECPF